MAYTPPELEPAYELRFEPLSNQGRSMAFPCDGQGHVDLDTLTDRARENYLYARAVIGREFGFPAVCPHAGRC